MSTHRVNARVAQTVPISKMKQLAVAALFIALHALILLAVISVSQDIVGTYLQAVVRKTQHLEINQL